MIITSIFILSGYEFHKIINILRYLWRWSCLTYLPSALKDSVNSIQETPFSLKLKFLAGKLKKLAGEVFYNSGCARLFYLIKNHWAKNEVHWLNLQGGYFKIETNFQCRWINKIRGNLKLRFIQVYHIRNNNPEIKVGRRIPCDYRGYNSRVWTLWSINQCLIFLCAWASWDVVFWACTCSH